MKICINASFHCLKPLKEEAAAFSIQTHIIQKTLFLSVVCPPRLPARCLQCDRYLQKHFLRLSAHVTNQGALCSERVVWELLSGHDSVAL